MAEAVSGLPAAQATGDRDEREARERGDQGKERDDDADDDRPRVDPGASDRGGS
jgi:hypothetical protein